ncbi:unnamed protein product [Oncorhynchus mykiss]|uniref:GRAM domain-containing protein n=1 Tax=Oncorhynchus mykiss TaxID=8022 RepID=A0A060YTE1_ONCMY|nr:unnamed protein product [Oncorhynchus mykiss]
MKHRRFSLDSSVSLEDGDGGNLLDQRRGSRSRPKKSGERRKSHSLEEAQLETQGLGCSLNRSNSLRSETIEEESFHRPDGVIVTKNSFVKYNKAFHKLFEDIPAEEKLTHAFTCALQKEVLYHGKLFVSVNYVCFYSSVLLKDTKVRCSNIQIMPSSPTYSALHNYWDSESFFLLLALYSILYILYSKQ